MKYLIKNVVLCLCSAVLLMNACTPMDYYYKDLITQADRVYTGKADSVWAMPGKERMKIAWIVPADPVAEQIRVFWNNGLDSVTTELGNPGDTGQVIIDGLQEIRYTFNVVTLGSDGNRSLPVELTADVYGDKFQATLRNRVLRQASLTPDSTILSWFEEFSETMIRTDMFYQDKAGDKQMISLLPTVTDTVLKDIDPTKEITFQSFFLPDSMAIDTFSSEVTTADLSDYQLRNLTLEGVGAGTADFIDFTLVSVQKEAGAAERPENIDLAHLRGSSSKHNLTAITNDAGFSAFSSALRNRIREWEPRNHGLLVNLGDDEEYATLYESLVEKDRAAMKAAFDMAASIDEPVGRLTQIQTGDIIFFHSVDRDIYVAIKVVSADEEGDLEITFKVSKPAS